MESVQQFLAYEQTYSDGVYFLMFNVLFVGSNYNSYFIDLSLCSSCLGLWSKKDTKRCWWGSSFFQLAAEMLGRGDLVEFKLRAMVDRKMWF